MRKLNLAAILISTTALTGCCHCGDEPLLKVNFQNFSTAELKTIYLISENRSDTCFTCVDTLSSNLVLWVNRNSKHQILSDSIPLNKTIQITDIKSKSTWLPRCGCKTIEEINYEFEGNSYTNKPVVITR